LESISSVVDITEFLPEICLDEGRKALKTSVMVGSVLAGFRIGNLSNACEQIYGEANMLEE
jgi:hypothetical protein